VSHEPCPINTDVLAATTNNNSVVLSHSRTIESTGSSSATTPPSQTPIAAPRQPRTFPALRCHACPVDKRQKESHRYAGPWRSHFLQKHNLAYWDDQNGYSCCGNQYGLDDAALMLHIDCTYGWVRVLTSELGVKTMFSYLFIVGQNILKFVSWKGGRLRG
jgi:hypothetical protein